jgi:hypothetical protein
MSNMTVNQHFLEQKRTPAWRWRLALRLVETGRRTTNRHDARTRELVRFARYLDRDADETTAVRLTHFWSDHNDALLLHMDPSSWIRWELEAWLLTDESFGGIARRMDIGEELVSVYHDCFFDVRERLHARGWVTSRILRSMLPGCLSERRDIDLFLKFYAYHGGVRALDALLDYYRRPPDTGAVPGELGPEARAELGSNLRIWAAILGRTLHADTPSGRREIDILRHAVDKLQKAEEEAAIARTLAGSLRCELRDVALCGSQLCSANTRFAG